MLNASVRSKRTKNVPEKIDRALDKGMRDAVGKGFSESQEALIQAGDQHGWDVFPVAQSGTPPYRVGDGWEFNYSHEVANIFEKGADPHPIEGDPVLAFEWPEMEGVEFGDTGQTFDEVFSGSWPTVFLPKVSHPGLPPIGYVRWGFEQTVNELRRKGLSPYVDAEF